MKERLAGYFLPVLCFLLPLAGALLAAARYQQGETDDAKLFGAATLLGAIAYGFLFAAA